jgi:hypothetical protein
MKDTNTSFSPKPVSAFSFKSGAQTTIRLPENLNQGFSRLSVALTSNLRAKINFFPVCLEHPQAKLLVAKAF